MGRMEISENLPFTCTENFRPKCSQNVNFGSDCSLGRKNSNFVRIGFKNDRFAWIQQTVST
jgi:hypothetical protein